MKYKRYLSIFLASTMAVTNAPLNALADTAIESVTEIDSKNADFSDEAISEDCTEEITNTEVTEETTNTVDAENIEVTEENISTEESTSTADTENSDEYNTEITTENAFENSVVDIAERDIDNTVSSDYIIDDGKYTADISFLNESVDAESMAGRYFNSTQVPVSVENGKVKVRIEYTTDLIDSLAQKIGDDVTELEIVTENDKKYVEIALNSVDEIGYLQIVINAGSFGKMTHIVRVAVKTDTITRVEEENVVKYSVPVKMVQASNPSVTSMGNGALNGDAVITVMNGKSTVELNFKATDFAGLYGHLTKLWSYPVTEKMDYSWWGDSANEIEADVTGTYMDYGLQYNQGDTTQSEFIKSVKMQRNTEKENSIYVRIQVDAMAGFDQAARLDLDWDNAKIIDNDSADSVVSIPVINVDKLNYGNSEKAVVNITSSTADAKIYYTTDGSKPNVNSKLYTGEFELGASSVYGGNVVVKAVAIKEGMVNSSVANVTLTFDAQKKIVVANNEELSASIEVVEGSVNNVAIEKIEKENKKVTVLKEIIDKSVNSKIMDINFELNENAEKVFFYADITDFDKSTTKLYRVTNDNNYEPVECTIDGNILSAEINTTGVYVIADVKNSNSNGNSESIEDGKYWMPIALWNANIDQESMGNSAFENNRQALVTVNNGIATVEVASNPVAVSGYTSALKSIQSSDATINVLSTTPFTTNTKFDGTEHSFDYISKFSFTTNNMDNEFLNVQISVPYTPMDGVVASSGGSISARLKLEWSSMSKTDDNTVLNPDSSSANGSSSSGGGSSVNTSDATTGIKIEADEFVFDDGTTFSTTVLNSGNEYKIAENLLQSVEFRLFNIKALVGSTEVKPNGQAKIYIPVNEKDKNIVIYRINQGDKTTEATKTELEYRISKDNKYYIITVKEFGIFAVAESVTEVKQEEKTDIITTEENANVSDNGNEKTAFSDIKNHWAYENILSAVNMGLFNGVNSSKFAPNETTTRAMFVTILGRLAGVNANKTGDSRFTDVKNNDYFYPYVMWAVENGIVNGLNDNKFGSSTNITREQMAVILYNFAKSQNIELKNIYSGSDFKDSDKISSWAVESIDALVRAGIIKGRENGEFAPKGTATRAEIATMFVNFTNAYMPQNKTTTND